MGTTFLLYVGGEAVLGFDGKGRISILSSGDGLSGKTDWAIVVGFGDMGGSRGSRRTPLDWENRMRIALSVARGLAHLHVSGKVVNGNIKSSNILLRPDHEACISDFGLNLLFGNTTPPSRVAGYRAPEVLETHKVEFKSDVYSFGVLPLELLTGKAPNQASLGEEGIDIPRWVQSVVREE
ncbi:hypothetical protein CRYUN_Cryun34aG0104000 [Craigia yunnanensis]